ncbi:MAG: hypothetical protein IKN67_05000 [Alphaproteobacteria bacterium]|nr:hypothetical protein [Alphaproteobacteria bacterium]
MRRLFLILGLILSISTNARADICYDVDKKIAEKAADIIRMQKEIYEYCSICLDVKPKIIKVDKVQTNRTIYVNDNAIDLAHTYYKQDNKFINLGVASGCIKAGEYDIPAELENLDTHINSKNKIKTIEQEFIECSITLETEEKKCDESWSMKCFDHLMQANRNAQTCYKQVAINLFIHYYDFSETDAEKRINTFLKFLYEQYSFIYNESNYCKRNNCGVSLYLYSEYATTQGLYLYVNKILGALSARD